LLVAFITVLLPCAAALRWSVVDGARAHGCESKALQVPKAAVPARYRNESDLLPSSELTGAGTARPCRELVAARAPEVLPMLTNFAWNSAESDSAAGRGMATAKASVEAPGQAHVVAEARITGRSPTLASVVARAEAMKSAPPLIDLAEKLLGRVPVGRVAVEVNGARMRRMARQRQASINPRCMSVVVAASTQDMAVTIKVPGRRAICMDRRRHCRAGGTKVGWPDVTRKDGCKMLAEGGIFGMVVKLHDLPPNASLAMSVVVGRVPGRRLSPITGWRIRTATSGAIGDAQVHMLAQDPTAPGVLAYELTAFDFRQSAANFTVERNGFRAFAGAEQAAMLEALRVFEQRKLKAARWLARAPRQLRAMRFRCRGDGLFRTPFPRIAAIDIDHMAAVAIMVAPTSVKRTLSGWLPTAFGPEDCDVEWFVSHPLLFCQWELLRRAAQRLLAAAQGIARAAGGAGSIQEALCYDVSYHDTALLGSGSRIAHVDSGDLLDLVKQADETAATLGGLEVAEEVARAATSAVTVWANLADSPVVQQPLVMFDTAKLNASVVAPCFVNGPSRCVSPTAEMASYYFGALPRGGGYAYRSVDFGSRHGTPHGAAVFFHGASSIGTARRRSVEFRCLTAPKHLTAAVRARAAGILGSYGE